VAERTTVSFKYDLGDSDEFRDINEGRLNIISPRDINTNKHVREFRLQ
jgi:hypothetical protein